MLRTLPSSLSHIGDLIDVLPEKDQTINYVVNKIKIYEEKDENINSKNKSGNTNVFKAEKKRKKTCYKCSKIGHAQFECGNRYNPGNHSRGGGQQQARGGARYQPQQHQDGSSYSGSSGSYRDRDAGKRG